MPRKNTSHKTWVEIHAPALRNNYRALRKSLPRASALAAVVKAHAYGHGIAHVVSVLGPLLSRNNDWLCVDALCEAREARNAGFMGRVLVMGYIPPDGYRECLDLDCDIVVYDEAVFEELRHCGTKSRPLRVHLEVETGLHRHGIARSRAGALSAQLKHCTTIELSGVMTHHADSEDVSPRNTFVRKQYSALCDAYRECTKMYGNHIPYMHSACSAGALAYPDLIQNFFRIGIALYGQQPSESVARHTSVELMPVLTWKTIIDRIETVQQGETVGYGRTWKASKKTTVATLPVGYADGYPRALSNYGFVDIDGVSCPIIGRICMNMCMADISRIRDRARRGSEVTLFSPHVRSRAYVATLAHQAQSIHYELLSRILPSIPRIICH